MNTHPPDKAARLNNFGRLKPAAPYGVPPLPQSRTPETERRILVRLDRLEDRVDCLAKASEHALRGQLAEQFPMAETTPANLKTAINDVAAALAETCEATAMLAERVERIAARLAITENLTKSIERAFRRETKTA